MSTLNLGNSPIITPLSREQYEWENSTMSFTVTFHKKDNVIWCNVGWVAKTSIATGASTSISSVVPVKYRPKEFFAFNLNGIGSAIYRVVIDSSGNISFWCISGTIGSNYSSGTSFMYLVDD